jgi:hypothetical protein
LLQCFARERVFVGQKQRGPTVAASTDFRRRRGLRLGGFGMRWDGMGGGSSSSSQSNPPLPPPCTPRPPPLFRPPSRPHTTTTTAAHTALACARLCASSVYRFLPRVHRRLARLASLGHRHRRATSTRLRVSNTAPNFLPYTPHPLCSQRQPCLTSRHPALHAVWPRFSPRLFLQARVRRPLMLPL